MAEGRRLSESLSRGGSCVTIAGAREPLSSVPIMSRFLNKPVSSTIALLSAAAAVSSSRAELTGDYSWVAYNNAVSGVPFFSENLGNTVPHVTDYSIERTHTPPAAANNGVLWSEGQEAPSPVPLLRFSDASDTGVFFAAEITGPTDSWYNATFRDSLGAFPPEGSVPGLNFGDVLGANYAQNGAYQNDNSQARQVYTYSGLDPDKRYTFAAIATQTPFGNARGSGGFARVTLSGADAFSNNSTLSAIMSNPDGTLRMFTGGRPMEGTADELKMRWDAVQASLGTGLIDHAFITGYGDDMIRFDEIEPGDDGEIQIVTRSFIGGGLNDENDLDLNGRNECVAIDFWALGQASEAVQREDFLRIRSITMNGSRATIAIAGRASTRYRCTGSDDLVTFTPVATDPEEILTSDLGGGTGVAVFTVSTEGAEGDFRVEEIP